MDNFMNFALLGDHLDGLDLACAVAGRGHFLAIYAGPAFGLDYLRRQRLEPERATDVEEVLADPAIELVIVAVSPAQRGNVLRRAVQSERHVLCLHPPDTTPVAAFEAANIQAGTGKLLLPLLPEAFHPAVARFADLLRQLPGPAVIDVERQSAEEFLLQADGDDPRAGLPGWDLLRRIGGEIVEVFGLATSEELAAGQPLLLAGRFESRGLFRATYLANQPSPRLRIAVVGAHRLELVFPDGWPGRAELHITDALGEPRTEQWEALAPWEPLVELVERHLGLHGEIQASRTLARSVDDSWTQPAPSLGWTDAIRALELDEAVRRSVHSRRAQALDLQEASEEANFKGTMTLVGCSLMWMALVLLILSVWVPWLGWFIFPAIAVFLGLQLLRWIVPRKSGPKDVGEPPTA